MWVNTMGYPDLESEVILDKGPEVGVILETTLLAWEEVLCGIREDVLFEDFDIGSSMVDRVSSSRGMGRLWTL